MDSEIIDGYYKQLAKDYDVEPEVMREFCGGFLDSQIQKARDRIPEEVPCEPSMFLKRVKIDGFHNLFMNDLRELPCKVQCFCCHSKEYLKKCRRCYQIYYCSVACQKKHWKTHKNECVSLDETKMKIFRKYQEGRENDSTSTLGNRPHLTNVDNVKKAVDKIFRICNYEPDRTYKLLQLISMWPFLLDIHVNVTEMNSLVSSTQLTDELVWELIDLLGLTEDLRGKAEQNNRKRTAQVQKIRLFCRTQCAVLREKLLQAFFRESRILKHIESELWECVLTHKEDGRAIAVGQWLELILALSKVDSQVLSKAFSKRISFESVPPLWKSSLSLREYLEFLWWEFAWLREYPDVEAMDRENKLREMETEGAENTGEIVGNKTGEELRDNFIRTTKVATQMKRNLCFVEKSWKGPVMWLPAEGHEDHDDLRDMMPADQVLALVKVHKDYLSREGIKLEGITLPI